MTTMGTKSYQNGKRGEDIVSKYLSERRYWVHNIQRRPNGSQPVDIVAIKSNNPLLLDVKYVSAAKYDVFSFSDVQADQETSMQYAIDYAYIESNNVGFAIVLERDEDEIRFLKYDEYKTMRYKEGKGGVHAYSLPLLGDIL